MSKKCMPLWREAHLQVKKIKAPHIRSTFGRSDVVLRGMHKGFCILPPVSKTRGLVKTPGPFKCVFTRYRCFFLMVLPSAGFTPSPKNSHERGKGKEHGEERERNRKKGPCLTSTIFDTKSYRFRYRFVIVRESCVRSFFSGNGCNHQKKSVATTQAPSLCRI